MNEDLFIIHFIIINSILSMTVVNDNPNERYPNSIDCNEGRSIALFIYIYTMILHTSNYKGTPNKIT